MGRRDGAATNGRSWQFSYGRICEHLAEGAGSLVFPERASRPIEAGLDLRGLFA